MRRLALVAGLLAACSSTTPPLSVGPTSTVTAADLSGTWSWGEGTPEPSPGPRSACLPGNPLTLVQQGTAVTGHLDVCGGPCLQGASLSGTNQGGTLALTGTGEDLQLKFDAGTQHLVGTHNGKAFWAVPFVKSTAPECQTIVQ